MTRASLEKISDTVLQDLVGSEADGITKIIGFQIWAVRLPGKPGPPQRFRAVIGVYIRSFESLEKMGQIHQVSEIVTTATPAQSK